MVSTQLYYDLYSASAQREYGNILYGEESH